MNDALARIAHRMQADAILGAVLGELAHLRRRDRVGDRQADPDGRHIVIGGGDGKIRPPHATVVQSQTVERLRGCHLVHEVQIDIEQIGFTGGGTHDVLIPNLLRQRLRVRHGPASTKRNTPSIDDVQCAARSTIACGDGHPFALRAKRW
ncbi:MAG: hypothetical protein QM753_08935 [Thermomicrobiales bacterium]